MMTANQDVDRAQAELDRETARELEMSLSMLADRLSARHPDMAASLRHEIRLLHDLMDGKVPAPHARRGGLQRLREVYNDIVVAGLYSEAKDASVLILLNRLLGV